MGIPNGNSGVITPLKTETTTNKEQSEEKLGKNGISDLIEVPHSHINKNPNHLVTANSNAAVD